MRQLLFGAPGSCHDRRHRRRVFHAALAARGAPDLSAEDCRAAVSTHTLCRAAAGQAAIQLQQARELRRDPPRVPEPSQTRRSLALRVSAPTHCGGQRGCGQPHSCSLRARNSWTIPFPVPAPSCGSLGAGPAGHSRASRRWSCRPSTYKTRGGEAGPGVGLERSLGCSKQI